MAYQRSIRESVSVSGTDFYNRGRVKISFHPLGEDKGIYFWTGKRQKEVKVSLENSRYVNRLGVMSYVSIRNKETGAEANMVEHILSPVCALGIDNLLIEIPGEYCPVMDRCAEEYFKALQSVASDQTARKKYWRYAKHAETRVDHPGGGPDSLTVGPGKGFVIKYRAYYPHKSVGKQECEFRVGVDDFGKEIAWARPPFFRDTPWKRFLSSLGNNLGIVAVNEKNYNIIDSLDSLNGARPGEFGEHKIMDAMGGALALSGREFKDTEFGFDRTGHRFDLYALKKLFRDECFEECE